MEYRYSAHPWWQSSRSWKLTEALDSKTQLKTILLISYTFRVVTSSSAIAERLRDALCPSVGLVSLNKITRAESLITRLQIYHCVTLSSAYRWGFLSYTSSLFPAINKLRRLPATSIINSPRSVAAKCIALAAGTVHSTQRFLPTPSAFDAPVRGVYVVILPCRLVQKNKNGVATRRRKKFEDMFIRCGTIHERDERTDRQTQRHRMTAKARGKNMKTIINWKRDLIFKRLTLR